MPGMAGFTLWPQPDPPLTMSLDIFKYGSEELQNLQLDQHARYFYTHFQCSLGHAMEMGWGIDRYVEFSKRVQHRVGFADHWFLGGGPLNTRDADREYWADILDPWINALLTNHAIDTACVGWQLDQYNEPGDKILGIIEYFADRLGPFDIPIGTHWVNEAGGWWAAGGSPQHPNVTDRFSWWRAMKNKVLWFHHQGPTHYPEPLRPDIMLPFYMFPDWGVPEYQARLCDTLNPFGDGSMGTSGLFGDRPFSLIVYENSAQAQFNDPDNCTESMGDLRSYLLCCTRAKTFVGGYGNGGCLPDGNPF
jgi:hypothetical protein